MLALVTVAWPDWIEIVTGSAPDGGSGALERAVVAGLAAAAMLLAVAALAAVAFRGLKSGMKATE